MTLNGHTEPTRSHVAALSDLLIARESKKIALLQSAVEHASSLEDFPHQAYLEETKNQVQEMRVSRQELGVTPNALAQEGGA